MTKRVLKQISVGIAVVLTMLLLWIELRDDPQPRPPLPPRSIPVKQQSAPVLEAVEHPPVAPPTEAPEEPSHSPAVPLIAITVRDIADGSPVPDLPFLIRGLVEPLRTDEQGVLHLRPGNLATLRPKGDDWSILRPANSVDPQEQETVWLHRYLRILGSICVDSELVELDPSRVRISVVAVGEDGTAGVVAREGLDTTWFLLHSLRRIKNVCKVAEDGSFEATIPRIPGFAISAAMPGWQPDQVPVPIKSDPCVVRLTLSKETLVLTGTVKSADGEPLAGVSVCGFVLIRIPADQLPSEGYAAKGHGYKLRISKESNQATIIYLLTGRTDANGGFRINSNVKGELSLFIIPGEGFQTTYVAQGLLSNDREDLDVVVERADASLLTITRSGTALKNARVLFGDLTVVVQPAFGQTLDDAGRLLTCNLIHGHKYNVSLKREAHLFQYFIWSGQKSIDLDKLPTQPPWRFGR